jgi:hypothetical protein
VREFAAEQVDDRAALEARHARYFLEFAEHVAEEAARGDRRAWLSRLARERGNLRAAFERLLEAGAAEDALRLAIAAASALPWDVHAHDVRSRLREALSRLPPDPTPLRAKALYWDGQLALSQARFAEAKRPLTEALAAARALDDLRLQAAALTALGRRAVLIADPSASALCEEAVGIAQDAGDPGLTADALLACAGACERMQEWERAAGLADAALRFYRLAGDLYGVAAAQGEQGFYDMVHGRLERSEQRLGEAVGLRRMLGDDRRLVEPLIDNAWLDLARGSGEAARLGFLDCLALSRQVGDQFNVAEALAGLSTLAAREGAHADAARLAGASAAISERIGAPPWESLVAIHERALEPVRQALGADAFAALHAEGARLDPDTAVARSRRLVLTR